MDNVIKEELKEIDTMVSSYEKFAKSWCAVPRKKNGEILVSQDFAWLCFKALTKKAAANNFSELTEDDKSILTLLFDENVLRAERILEVFLDDTPFLADLLDVAKKDARVHQVFTAMQSGVLPRNPPKDTAVANALARVAFDLGLDSFPWAGDPSKQVFLRKKREQNFLRGEMYLGDASKDDINFMLLFSVQSENIPLLKKSLDKAKSIPEISFKMADRLKSSEALFLLIERCSPGAIKKFSQDNKKDFSPKFLQIVDAITSKAELKDNVKKNSKSKKSLAISSRKM